MTATTPTPNQRLLLDVIGNIPSDWEIDVTYPTLPEVAHRFDSLPEIVLTTDGGDQTHEIAVRAVITGQQVFQGYAVTTTYPETAVLTATCRDRRLSSLSQQELLSEGVDIVRHPGLDPTSEAVTDHSLSLAPAASLAGYYAASTDVEAIAVDEHASPVVSATDD